MLGFPCPYDNTGVTVELREIIENGVNIWGFDYPVPRATIDYNGKTCVVDFNKEDFERKIIDHYYFRQIGQETIGRFLHYFRSRIREIMPYYVQLYEFDAKFRNIDDPLESYNLVETFLANASTSGTSENEGTFGTNRAGSNHSERRFSNTPQGNINNLDSYITEATREDIDTTEMGEDTSSNTATNSSESENSHTLTRKGNIGVQPLGGEVENIRKAFVNIDLMIIDELKDLFLQVY